MPAAAVVGSAPDAHLRETPVRSEQVYQGLAVVCGHRLQLLQ